MNRSRLIARGPPGALFAYAVRANRCSRAACVADPFFGLAAFVVWQGIQNVGADQITNALLRVTSRDDCEASGIRKRTVIVRLLLPGVVCDLGLPRLAASES